MILHVLTLLCFGNIARAFDAGPNVCRAGDENLQSDLEMICLTE